MTISIYTNMVNGAYQNTLRFNDRKCAFYYASGMMGKQIVNTSLTAADCEIKLYEMENECDRIIRNWQFDKTIKLPPINIQIS